eukprot:5451232-Prymnesium_polylepis.1
MLLTTCCRCVSNPNGRCGGPHVLRTPPPPLAHPEVARSGPTPRRPASPAALVRAVDLQREGATNSGQHGRSAPL